MPGMFFSRFILLMDDHFMDKQFQVKSLSLVSGSR